MVVRLMNAQRVVGLSDRLSTPLGVGISQGRMDLFEDGARFVRYVVRLPIDEKVQAALGQSNCLTKNATRTALFVFAEGEVRQA